MNPFSGFLQPTPQRPIDTSGVNDVVRTIQQNKEFKQRQLENTQRNAIEQQQANRGDAELALQQGEQTHRFGIQDQKQQEDALAEYHDAVDTGDSVRIGRATDMLKRLGMNVGGQAARPDLKAFTGQSLLPSVQQKPSPDQLQALTGQPPNPIDQAIKTEQASRDALRARNEAPISQEDFESQLIAGNDQAPQSSAPEPDIAGHLKSVANLKPLKLNTPQQQETEFSSRAKPEEQNEPPGDQVIDLDDGQPPQELGKPLASQPVETTSQAPQAAGALPPRLPGQLLPTVISKNGKVLEESQGQQGRYSPMVAATFEPFASHENPSIAAAGKRAQGLASRLVNVDGISPKQAIEFAGKQLENEMLQINNLERTKIGSKAHVQGPGGPPVWDPQKDKSESIRMYAGQARTALSPLNKADSELAEAQGSLSSDSPAAQRDALMKFVQARSGATVSDRERGRYDGLDGSIVALKNRLSAILGGAPDKQFNQDLLAIINRRRAFNQKMRQEIAQEYSEGYGEQNDRKAPPEMLDKRKVALKKMILSGGGMSTAPGGDGGEEDNGDNPNAHLWE